MKSIQKALPIQTSLYFTGMSVFIFATVLPGFSTAYANPHSDQPGAALAAHGTIAEAKKMVAALYQQYDQLLQELKKIEELSSTPDRVPARQLQDIGARLFQARQMTWRLKLMGEPAGWELEPRFYALLHMCNSSGRRYGGTQPGTVLRQKLAVRVQRRAKAWQNSLVKLQQAFQSGQFETVSGEVEKMALERIAFDTFGTLKERKAYWDPTMTNIVGPWRTGIEPMLRQQYGETAIQKVAGEMAAVEEFERIVPSLTAGIQADGRFTLEDGQKLNTVQAFSWIADRWAALHTGLVRSQTIDGAFRLASRDNIEQSAQRLSEVAIGGLSDVVQIAGQKTPDAEVIRVYGDLLKLIAITSVRVKGNALGQELAGSLQAFRSSHPDLNIAASAYESATSEVLRMRREFAEQQASELKKSMSAITSVIGTKTKATPPSIIAPKQFGGGIDQLVEQCSAEMVGQNYSFSAAVRLSPKTRLAVVPYQNDCYSNIALPNIDEQQAELERVLLVSENQPALTLEAASAVATAEHLDFVGGGGTVRRVHLEAAVSRFASLPNVASVLCPLGTFPKGDSPEFRFEEIVWRFDLTPTWLHHEYFVFVDQPVRTSSSSRPPERTASDSDSNPTPPGST